MKKIIVTVAVLFMIMQVNCDIIAQSVEQDSASSNTRTVFVSIGSGFPEFISAKIGYQINNEWSGSIKISDYYNGAGGRLYLGTVIWGVKVTKHFEPIVLINNASFELGYDKNGPNNNYDFDFSIGFESTEKILIKPYWAICLSLIKSDNNDLYVTPGIKVGININL